MPTSFIAISGPSGSGKTWLASQLQASLADDHPQLQSSVLSEDAYYRDQSKLSYQQRLQTNYDHPDALEHDLLIAHLYALKSGAEVDIPAYDYAAHTRSDCVRKVYPAPVILIEGILVFHQVRLRRQFDLSIYLDTPLDCCLERRIRRDVEERGRTEDSIRQQFVDSVLPMHERYVAPCREHADVILDGSAIDRDQVRILKEKIVSLLAVT